MPTGKAASNFLPVGDPLLRLFRERTLQEGNPLPLIHSPLCITSAGRTWKGNLEVPVPAWTLDPRRQGLG